MAGGCDVEPGVAVRRAGGPSFGVAELAGAVRRAAPIRLADGLLEADVPEDYFYTNYSVARWAWGPWAGWCGTAWAFVGPDGRLERATLGEAGRRLDRNGGLSRPLPFWSVDNVRHWQVMATTAFLPLLWLAVHGRRARVRRRRKRRGLCRRCGYDLRASAGRCPECGAVPDRAVRRTIVRGTLIPILMLASGCHRAGLAEGRQNDRDGLPPGWPLAGMVHDARPEPGSERLLLDAEPFTFEWRRSAGSGYSVATEIDGDGATRRTERILALDPHGDGTRRRTFRLPARTVADLRGLLVRVRLLELGRAY